MRNVCARSRLLVKESMSQHANFDALTKEDKELIGKSSLPGAKDLFSADNEKRKRAAYSFIKSYLEGP